MSQVAALLSGEYVAPQSRNNQVAEGTQQHISAMIAVPPRPRTPGTESGDLMARFDRIQPRISRKKVVDCFAAKANYQQPGRDFLQNEGCAWYKDNVMELHSQPNINETRFHRGFQRRPYAAIQQDADRLKMECQRDRRRQQKEDDQVLAARAMLQHETFNVLSGEGVGREKECPTVGKKMLLPTGGNIKHIFPEHHRNATNRMRQSLHRFYEHPAPWDGEKSVERKKILDICGGIYQKPESLILGYGEAPARLRMRSVGAKDNFAHLQTHNLQPQYEKARQKNASQISFG